MSFQGEVFSAGSDGHLKLWSPQDGRCEPFALASHGVHTISTESGLLASAGAAGVINVWSLADSTCQASLHTELHYVLALAMSDQGELLVGGYGSVILCYRATRPPREDASAPARFEQHPSLEGHTGDVLSLCILGGRNAPRREGTKGMPRAAASGSIDHSIRLWDLETGGCLRVILGHNGGVSSIACTPNGRLLLSGGIDRTPKTFAATDGTLLRIGCGHEDYVLCIALHPHEELAATGAADRSLRLWKLALHPPAGGARLPSLCSGFQPLRRPPLLRRRAGLAAFAAGSYKPAAASGRPGPRWLAHSSPCLAAHPDPYRRGGGARPCHRGHDRSAGPAGRAQGTGPIARGAARGLQPGNDSAGWKMRRTANDAHATRDPVPGRRQARAHQQPF